ncbi:hypothetical protein [Aneurinibacillus tyrosinisolvens]|uniref:hypothetical protein n=1 Tax=Aneurinibacillus tyrosinisolvens TaxID=1443435 RepID=UPI00063EFEAD|nr:hypothetical protein [Aneurinibacillus tyrosinisolvens]
MNFLYEFYESSLHNKKNIADMPLVLSLLEAGRPLSLTPGGPAKHLGILGVGDNCRSFSPYGRRAPQGGKKRAVIARDVFL